MIVICDIETDALYNPTKIWCIVCKELETGKVHRFLYPHYDAFKEFASGVSKWVMHNGIHFDAVHISNFICPIDINSVVDTLILSRLFNYSIDGDGHSLDAWGKRLGSPKLNFNNFSALTDKMVEYCIQDVELTYKLFKEVFLKYYNDPEWTASIELELKCAVLSEEMSREGFPFDVDTAKTLKEQFEQRIAVLDKDIIDAFPPKVILLREITPKATKYGTIHKGDFRFLSGLDAGIDLTAFSVGCPFSLIDYQPFNPGSVKQIVERMNAAGWHPVEKTKTHIETERKLKTCRDRRERAKLLERLKGFQTTGWKVSEANLATLPDTAPKAAQLLRERLILARRASTLEEWINAYRPSTRRIHGTFQTIGAWTHRVAHQGPNFANIVSTDKPFGPEMRGLWRAEPDQYLIDVDADGIQLRVLAHYIDDPAFTLALVSGNKNDGTDAHSLNKKALGEVCKTRDIAKTFIYSWLLGAGAAMTAKVLGCSLTEAKQARENFENFYPGLRKLKTETIPFDAQRGYFIGFDGRKVLCDSEHHMLSGYLQNGESVIMKTAWVLAKDEIERQRIPGRFINFVHDEFVYLCPRISEVAERAKRILCEAIKNAGEVLKLKCPMAGSGHIGDNWAQVH